MNKAIRILCPVLVTAICTVAQTGKATAPQDAAKVAPQTYTLIVSVDGVNQQGGNIGILVFQNDKGWPEDRLVAFKDIHVPAHPGSVVITVPGLPPGNYAVSAGHDVNLNRKVDKNWFGKPTEQWGMSNNPHATVKAPPFSKAMFTLNHDSEIHIQLQ